MKKFLFLLFVIFPFFACAESMCVKNGSVMVVLDPQINGSALSNNATGKTWSASFSYGIISGIGGCYSNVGTTQGGVASNQNITPYTTGTHCYCKMLKPAESAWVYSGNYHSNNNNCAASCVGNCVTNVAASTVALRRGMFGNIVEY